eukprot:3850795-Rhodomonas_salina.1
MRRPAHSLSLPHRPARLDAMLSADAGCAGVLPPGVGPESVRCVGRALCRAHGRAVSACECAGNAPVPASIPSISRPVLLRRGIKTSRWVLELQMLANEYLMSSHRACEFKPLF